MAMVMENTMSSAATSRWKNNEKQIPDLFAKWGIEAYRKTRGADFSKSDTDAEIIGEEWLKLDGKYSVAGFATSRILSETEAKYCKEKGDFAVLFCKAYKEVGQRIVIDDDLFAGLLSYFMGRKTKEEVIAQWKS